MRHLGNSADRKSILDRIAALSPASERRWGCMTVGGMLCHLTDSYGLPLGERPASMATGLYQRTIMKWAALYVVTRWPQSTPTRPEFEQGAGGTPPVEFQADRARLTRSIERFSEPGRRFEGHPHPFFGPLTARQWLRWGYLHADHHLRQFGV